MPSRICMLLFLFGLIAVPGCSGPRMARVKGRVTCNGQPVAEAFVTFNPIGTSEADKEAGKPGTGITDANGYYELSTYKALDGALVGADNVVVFLDNTNKTKCLPRNAEGNREKRLTLEVKAEGNEHNFELDK